MDRRSFLRVSSGALAGAAAASRARQAVAQTRNTLSMVLTGDVILTRRVSGLSDPGFAAVRALLTESDCTIGNCELVIAARSEGVPSAAGRSLSSVVRPHMADELRWLGFDMMGTANNHTLDYGSGGVAATIAHLERVGIVSAGTGANLQQAAEPRYVDTPGGRVALVGCASTVAPHAPAVWARGDYPGVPGTNTVRLVRKYQVPKGMLDAIAGASTALAPVQFSGAAFPVPPGVTFMGSAFVEGPTADLLSDPHPADVKRITEAIATARTSARIVVASIHAHEIYRDLTTPDPFLPKLAHAAIDAGADVFAIHGSHYMAGMEIYKGKPIFYGLGDFFFQYHTFEALGRRLVRSLRPGAAQHAAERGGGQDPVEGRTSVVGNHRAAAHLGQRPADGHRHPPGDAGDGPAGPRSRHAGRAGSPPTPSASWRTSRGCRGRTAATCAPRGPPPPCASASPALSLPGRQQRDPESRS